MGSADDHAATLDTCERSQTGGETRMCPPQAILRSLVRLRAFMAKETAVSTALADTFRSFDYADLAERHHERLHQSVVDVLACGFAGVGTRHHRAALDLLENERGPATVLGRADGASVETAVFANTTTAHVLTYDDRHRASSTHPGSMVVPTALAVGETTGASGRDVLRAVFAGYETIGRLGKLRRGFNTDLPRRPTPVFGPLGTAVTAGLLYELDAPELASAIGYAANLGGGMSQVWVEGTDEYAVQAGLAARHGVTAARIAATGLTAAPHTIEGDYGFYRAFFGEVPDNVEEVARPPGDPNELDDVYGKPIPACGMVVVPVQLAEEFRREGVTDDDIERIDLTVSGLTEDIPGCSHAGPFDSPTRALMSIPFGVASTFVHDGYAWSNCADHYDDPRIQALVDRVDLSYDDSFGKYRTELHVHLKDGGTRQKTADQPDEMTPADVEAKFREHAASVLSAERADDVLSTLQTLEDLADIGSLTVRLRSL